MRRLSLLCFSVLALAFAAAAVAATESELLAQAQALDTSYSALKVRFDLGNEAHSTLKSDYKTLESQRAQLKADRATLPPECGCSALDAAIAHIDSTSGYISRLIQGWEEGT